ncbi:MAG: asparaginase [Pseudomonadota bacterium]
MDDHAAIAPSPAPIGALGTPNPVLVEVWRGPVLESVHRGAVAVVDGTGRLVAGLGDPSRIILPRSSAKPLQALPLVESGAADAAGLSSEQLALSCASHSGAAIHTERVAAWLSDLGLDDDALRCGRHPPLSSTARQALREAGETPQQRHNNCSGKHTGFLTLTRHLGAGPDYVALDHPVQQAVRMALAEGCDEEPAGHAIDGCSAPNFAVSLTGLARAVAGLAVPALFGGLRGRAAERLREAMIAHPVLVAGEERVNTQLMQAAGGGVALKSGAEGVFVAALPALGLGVALKIDDGADRAAQTAIAGILAGLGGMVDTVAGVVTVADQTLTNAAGLPHGRMRAVEAVRELA